MKKRLILLVLAIVIFVIGYKYIYHAHRNIETEHAEFALTATSLSNEFLINPMASEKKYLNKTIEVSGDITEINSRDLILNEAVFCQFSNAIGSSIKRDEHVKIKGRVIGYDDLLELVKLDQCSIMY